ncbi:MAG: hypothetical protein KBT65_15070 [Sulfitobacter sp.]|nr:hypothetical protein [Sulfitobacter sp.]
MFNSVKSIVLATSVSLAAMSAAAFANEEIIFSEVTVEAGLEAAEDTNALEVFPEIATDLQQAISTRVKFGSDASLPTIKVDLRSVSLNGNPMLTPIEGFNEIAGVVVISDDNNSIGSQSFPVNVAAYPAEQVIPEGFIGVQPSEEDFYNAMILGFADVIVRQLDTVYKK